MNKSALQKRGHCCKKALVKSKCLFVYVGF
nr:MAG TPA: protein of unknown function (DUF5522) [Caudoviricetes sp.]